MTAYTNPAIIPKNYFNRILFYLFIFLTFLILLAAGYLIFHAQITRIFKKPNKPTFAQPLLKPISNPISTAIHISCPTVSSFCTADGKYTKDSLSGKLPINTPIYAVFSGEAEGLASFHPLEPGGHEEFTLILLTNQQLGLQAMYFVKGNVFTKKMVKEGEQIGILNGQIINYLNENALVFKLMKATQTGADVVSLTKANFK